MALILLAGVPYELEAAVGRALAAQKHDVITARDAAQTLASIRQSCPALVILNTDLPDRDGFHLCADLRVAQEGHDLPILFLTDRDALPDKLSAFAAGADDYLTVPFHIPELLLRVEALLRRAARPSQPAAGAHSSRRFGPITMDRQTGEVRLFGGHITLTPVEARLLDYLMDCAGQPASAEELLRHVWGQAPRAGDPALVRVHIRHLRARLEADPAWPKLLVTVPRLGYCLVENDAL